MTTPTHPLAMQHVAKAYRSGDTVVQALDDVSLTVAPGEFIAVTGPSGSGKSTLLHCASGLDTCDSGSILLGGTDITRLSDRKLTLLRRSATGFIFQAYNLMKTKTARENIVYPPRLQKRRPDKDWLAQVVRTLGIEDLLDRYPNQLSGGQQQRVAVARSMMARPQILFADEPTGALDSASSDQLLDLFRWCTRQLGVTVLMVTHDRAAAARADRVIEMMDGRVRRELRPETAGAVAR
ncbi:ABC transporter ATP-binding protein [Arthrobacter sp.]|uniref:ABC transporter ATP-binding protein n=1 Tax=Arthrobacter sp. TaxID=1667 RepID=UPI003A928251